MAKLIYGSNMSLDGCTEDERGAFDWARPDDEVFVFITKLMGSAGTYLYGRRMYETLAVWETDSTLAVQSDLMADYASAWQAATRSSTPRPWPPRSPRTRGSNAASTPARYTI
jgi:hypothetical protein